MSQFICPQCQKIVRADLAAKPRDVLCPRCKQRVRIPGTPQAEAEVPSSPPVVSQHAGFASSSANDQDWLIHRGNDQFGPYDRIQIATFAQSGRLLPSDLAWRPGMPQWMALHLAIAGLNFPPPAPELPPMPRSRSSDYEAERRAFIAKRIPAALCALFVGCLGIHKFVLGINKPGTTMLITWLICIITSFLILPLVGVLVLAVIALVEGIIYLTMDDETFYQTYAIEQKQWF